MATQVQIHNSHVHQLLVEPHVGARERDAGVFVLASLCECLQKHGRVTFCSSRRREMLWFLGCFLLASSFTVAIVVLRLGNWSQSRGSGSLPLLPLPKAAHAYETPGGREHQVIRNLESLNALSCTPATAITSITVTDLDVGSVDWPAPPQKPHQIGINSSTCPTLTSIRVQAKVSEHTLLQLVGAFAPTLNELTLDMECLCLGGRLDRVGLTATPALALPKLRRLTLLNSNGCPLTPWLLTWHMPECATFNFCSSCIDEATIEVLADSSSNRSRHAGERTGLLRQARVVSLHNTALCASCQFKSTRLTVVKTTGPCPVTDTA